MPKKNDPFEKIKDKVVELPDALSTDTKKKYRYASANKRTTAAFSLSEFIQDKLDRAAYWDRKNKSRLVEQALTQFLEGKDYDPVPTED